MMHRAFLPTRSIRSFYGLGGLQTLRNRSGKGKNRMEKAWEKASSRVHNHPNNNQAANNANLSDFNGILRKLLKRSHPDLIKHSHPEHFATNTTSLQVLNDLLNVIRTPGKNPSMTYKDLTFFLRDEKTPSMVNPFVLRLRTGGGSCRNSLTQSFEEFFQETRLVTDGKFYWNSEYFVLPIVSNAEELQQVRAEAEKEREEAERAARYDY